ncbi:ABC transporter ATP-binding protein [Lactobacillus sp. 3B(2020)]|uniref:ABC transporter ATP-binding protein n=1 Tax=Lactobacillus sp. 3B(2020) TaxID=2695882 RepID=UPI0015E00171|nr:ABC transporter ATP-binding protein [Lactobacillus sp. 3B(2020)]QLL70032.1 ATP-binding cassette domain-containing protein [Lactobacillus sp. 3B(2020)]
MSEPLLCVNNLSYQYQANHPLLKGISFQLARGEILTLLGPNGIGKSTLLRCLTNLTNPTAGKITLQGTNLSRLSHRQRAQRMALVPQNYQVNADLSVFEYILMGRIPYHSFFGGPSPDDCQIAIHWLQKLGIVALKARPLNTLSGGQMQLVAITRALVQNPQLLILDEPMAALDIRRQAQVLGLIKHLQASGVTIIITSHLPNHAFILGGKVGLLMPNQTWLTGPVDKIATAKNLQTLYQTPLKVFYSPSLKRQICEIDSLN